jgi:hypothetical protein
MHVCVCVQVLALERDRLRYLLKSYLRTRLHKIQEYAGVFGVWVGGWGGRDEGVECGLSLCKSTYGRPSKGNGEDTPASNTPLQLHGLPTALMHCCL